MTFNPIIPMDTIWRFFLYITVAEFYQFVIVIFWNYSISFMPTLFKFQNNKYMWINILIEQLSLMVWWIFFGYTEIKRLCHTAWLWLSLFINLMAFGYNVFYVITGLILFMRYENNVLYFPDKIHKGFYVTYLSLFGLNLVIIMYEILMILRFFNGMEKYRKKIREDKKNQ